MAGWKHADCERAEVLSYRHNNAVVRQPEVKVAICDAFAGDLNLKPTRNYDCQRCC